MAEKAELTEEPGRGITPRSIASKPDPAVQATGGALNRISKRSGTSADKRNARNRGVRGRGVGRGRNRDTPSPVGTAFGSVAALGIAKLLTSGVRSRDNKALQEQRFQQTEGRQTRNTATNETNVESLVDTREANTAQGAERLGIVRERDKGLSERATTAEARLQQSSDRGFTLGVANVALNAGVPLKEGQAGDTFLNFDIPAKVSGKMSDEAKEQLKFIRSERAGLRSTGGRLKEGNEQRDIELGNEESQFIGLGDRFGPEAVTRRQLLKNSRVNRGVTGNAGR